jgi:taurine dioxygenase
MINVVPSGEVLGATVNGLDLAVPLLAEDFGQLLGALGRRGVLRIPGQSLTSRNLRDFSAHFGELEINVAADRQEDGLPEVMTLSNIVVDGKPIGLADAGQGWHTDMSYNRIIAFVNVLYGIEIPRRDGKALGATQFCNMHAAYRELPQKLKLRLDGMTAIHTFEKFWETMRQNGSSRPELSAEQRSLRPPVTHPIFLDHPISGQKVLYCNPGYTVRIKEVPADESDELLEQLFEHQLQERFRFTANWTEGDVLIWDNIGTIHCANADYTPDEHRLIKRCQVAATRFFDSNTALPL